MTMLFLKGVAEEIVKQLAEHGCLNDQAIVITEDFKMQGLMGRFIEKENLSLLNSRLIGEILPGLEVYIFGTEELYSTGMIELTFLPSRYTHNSNGNKQAEINLSYLFKVNIRKSRYQQSDFSVSRRTG